MNEEWSILCSLKYGSNSGKQNGRFFTDMDGKSIVAMLIEIPESQK